MALPNLQSYNFQIQAGVSVPAYERYAEPVASQAAVEQRQTLLIPASTNYVALNLATWLAALTDCEVILVKEITSPGTGFQVSSVNTNPGFTVRPGSIFAGGISGFPTLYFSNPNATPIELQITVLGS